MAYAVMACIVMAGMVMTDLPDLRQKVGGDQLHSYGLYTYGLYSHGLYSYSLHSYGLYSYGLNRKPFTSSLVDVRSLTKASKNRMTSSPPLRTTMVGGHLYSYGLYSYGPRLRTTMVGGHLILLPDRSTSVNVERAIEL